MKIPALFALAVAVTATAFYFVAEKDVAPAPSATIDPATETAAPAAGKAMSSTDVAEIPATDVRASEPAATAGYRLEVDPATGEFIEPAQPSAPHTEAYPQEMQNSLSRSTDGLVTKTAPVGGGKMVDLQGRFQATYTATVDENNKLEAGCDLPQTDDEEDQR